MIGHRRYRRLLPLYVRGTIGTVDRERVERHLSVCASCRGESEEIGRLQALLQSVPPVEFPEDEVAGVRARALGQLHALRARPWFAPSQFGALSRPLVRAAGLATAAVLLVLVGYWGGRTITQGDVADAGAEAALEGVRVTHVRSSLDDMMNPIVEVGYEQTRRAVVRGRPEDPAIQRVLAQALMSGLNAGVRLRAVGAVNGQLSPSPDPEVKAALLLALTSDTNDGVRKAALEAVLRFDADMKVRDALLQVVLHDDNPGLRIAAINGLDSLRLRGVAPDQPMRALLEGSARNDENLVVRVKARSLLEENRQ